MANELVRTLKVSELARALKLDWNGLDLEIKKTNGILYVNGAEVVESNIKFSKGVIHLTNRVLIPK